jgi:sporadic carbohydrate cluster 2OG-Fe(II) oxygenase
LLMSESYYKYGYIIEDADHQYLASMKKSIEDAFMQYCHIHGLSRTSLEDSHRVVDNSQSNDLRLFVMQYLFTGTSFHRDYYNSAKHIIHHLCGNELAMQKRPGLSINLSRNPNDILPIHADTWNGVSPFELNIWIPFVNCHDSLCLYILKRDAYQKRLVERSALLKLSSDELFDELFDDLTWINIKYGQVLAFDQSLPHGYSLNEENVSHWSTNCRFKGLHTPYWDKKLGEYFMPITVKNCTRLGMSYKHPENWI